MKLSFELILMISLLRVKFSSFNFFSYYNKLLFFETNYSLSSIKSNLSFSPSSKNVNLSWSYLMFSLSWLVSFSSSSLYNSVTFLFTASKSFWSLECSVFCNSSSAWRSYFCFSSSYISINLCSLSSYCLLNASWRLLN